MTPHIMTMLENIFRTKERKLVHEQLMKSLMGDPSYPLIIVWIKDDGEVLDAFGGAVRKLGVKKWKSERRNIYDVYPQVKPHIEACIESNAPVYFDWVGEGRGGKDIWLKCFAVPMIAMDFRFVCGFAFDISQYKFLRPTQKEEEILNYQALQIEYSLTDAEVEVCKAICAGVTMIKDISHRLNRSENTIKTHMVSIRRKMGVQNQKANIRNLLMAKLPKDRF